MIWKFRQLVRKPKLNNPILIEGLPGIGNVGKVAIDFIIDELKAKKLYEIVSYAFPHSVFINEDNLVELPMIEIYYKKFKSKRNDLLLLAGDVQPVDEVSSYEFCDRMLDMLEEFDGKEVITLGGIGLPEIPKSPRVYCTGNSKDIIKKYKSRFVYTNLYGIVGPIVGVSGLLLGLAALRDIKAVSLLAETYGHPMYLGVKGAREILKVLNQKLNLKLDLNKLKRDIEEVEEEIIKKTQNLELSRQVLLKKLKSKFLKDVSYIG